FARLPTAVYGGSLLTSAIAYLLLQKAITRKHGEGATLAKALGRDLKGKISPLIGHPVGVFEPVDRSRALSSGGAHVARARPAHRAEDRRELIGHRAVQAAVRAKDGEVGGPRRSLMPGKWRNFLAGIFAPGASARGGPRASGTRASGS